MKSEQQLIYRNLLQLMLRGSVGQCDVEPEEMSACVCVYLGWWRRFWALEWRGWVWGIW